MADIDELERLRDALASVHKTYRENERCTEELDRLRKENATLRMSEKNTRAVLKTCERDLRHRLHENAKDVGRLKATLQSIITRAGTNAEVSGVVPSGWIMETLKIAREALEGHKTGG